MTDKTITFHIGQENKPVIESSDFDNSIFVNQYRAALAIVDRYLRSSRDRTDENKNEDCDAFQGMAFCGERGDGKTSALLSFLNILNNADEIDHYCKKKDKNIEFIKTTLGKDSPLLKNKLQILEMIDPSRFANYNILEVILSQLYKLAYPDSGNKPFTKYPFDTPELLMDFQEVRRTIILLSKKNETLFDALEDFKELSGIMELKARLRKIVKQILKITDSARLIIPIDDVDLKIDGVYEMVERLRKYFSIPEVIVVMAVKSTQLASSIHHALRVSVKGSESFSDAELEKMTEKYLVKFLPQNCRVQMPGVDGIFDRKFEIRDNNDDVLYRNETFKDGVLEQIFIKTRYLFYNSFGEVSTLFPTNLRELFHFVGLIADMKLPHTNGDDIHRLNQQRFKNYFFGTWTESLDKKFRAKALDWSSSFFDYTLNKEVIQFIKESFGDYLNRGIEYSSDTDGLEEGPALADNAKIIKDSILEKEDFTYNLSIGDVFFILDIIEKEILPDSEYKFLFFIRSLYSIKLYDKYDYIVHNKLGFLKKSPSAGIYRNDERFSDINLLQRLVAGSYFTFIPGELIKFNELTTPCDIRIIKNYYEKDGLQVLINTVVNDGGKNALLLNVAEFFVLTVSHAVTSKDKMSSVNEQSFPVKYMADARKNSTPMAFSSVSPNKGFLEFNVVAPFANVINIKHAYERFNKGDELFKLSLKNSDSLLCQMWSKACESRGMTEAEWEETREATITQLEEGVIEEQEKNEIISDSLHILLSDGIIRNAEVLVALKDHFKYIVRRISKDGTNKGASVQGKILDKLSAFYDLVVKESSSMTTHRFKYEENKSGSADSRHRISFNFLSAVSEFIKQLSKLDKLRDDNPKKLPFIQFFNIYDWAKNAQTAGGKKNSSYDNDEQTKRNKKDISELFTLSQPLEAEAKSGRNLFEPILTMSQDNPLGHSLSESLETLKEQVNYKLWEEEVKLVSWRDRLNKNRESWTAILTNPIVEEYIRNNKNAHPTTLSTDKNERKSD